MFHWIDISFHCSGPNRPSVQNYFRLRVFFLGSGRGWLSFLRNDVIVRWTPRGATKLINPAEGQGIIPDWYGNPVSRISEEPDHLDNSSSVKAQRHHTARMSTSPIGPLTLVDDYSLAFVLTVKVWITYGLIPLSVHQAQRLLVAYHVTVDLCRVDLKSRWPCVIQPIARGRIKFES